MNFAALRPFANLVQHGYVTTDLERAEQGHYFEYICPSEQGAREYAALPQNDR